MRSLAWTKHLLFPELSTVADCTVEAVGSHHGTFLWIKGTRHPIKYRNT